MKYFIGIVPPAEIFYAVVNIQRRFGDNRLEPHITLRPPVTVTNEAAWFAQVEQICATFPPISISLTGTGNFGKGVLFIGVKSIPLSKLHHSIMQAVMPFEQADTDPQTRSYNPHLTLGRSWCGFTQQHLSEMKKLADEYLFAKPVSFIAAFVRIYFKQSDWARYTAFKDVRLIIV